MTGRPRTWTCPRAGVFLRAARVSDWLHFLALPLVMFDPSAPDIPSLARGVVLAALLLAFAYGWNTVKDEKWGSPAQDTDHAPTVSTRQARLVTAALFLVGAVAMAYSAFTNPLVAGSAAVALVSSYVYSGGPRWKAVPLVGTLLNLGIFIPLCFLAAPGTQVSGAQAFLVVLFASLLLQNQVVHEAAHLPQDSRNGIRTTVASIGLRHGLLLAHGLGIPAIVLICIRFLAGPWWGVLAALPLLFFHVLLTADRFGSPDEAVMLRRMHRYAAMACGAVAWSSFFLA